MAHNSYITISYFCALHEHGCRQAQPFMTIVLQDSPLCCNVIRVESSWSDSRNISVTSKTSSSPNPSPLPPPPSPFQLPLPPSQCARISRLVGKCLAPDTLDYFVESMPRLALEVSSAKGGSLVAFYTRFYQKIYSQKRRRQYWPTLQLGFATNGLFS